MRSNGLLKSCALLALVLVSPAVIAQDVEDPESALLVDYRSSGPNRDGGDWVTISKLVVNGEGNPQVEVDLSGERAFAAGQLLELLRDAKRDHIRSRTKSQGNIGQTFGIDSIKADEDGFEVDARRSFTNTVHLDEAGGLSISDATGGRIRDQVFSTNFTVVEYPRFVYEDSTGLLTMTSYANTAGGNVRYLPLVESPRYNVSGKKTITTRAGADSTSFSADYKGPTTTDGKEPDPGKLGVKVTHAYEKSGSKRIAKTNIDMVTSTAATGIFIARERKSRFQHEIIFTLTDSWTSEIVVELERVLTDDSISCKEKGLATYSIGFNIEDKTSSETSAEASCESKSSAAKANIRWSAGLARPVLLEGRTATMDFVVNRWKGDEDKNKKIKREDWLERWVQPRFLDNQLYSFSAYAEGAPGITMITPPNLPRGDVAKKPRFYTIEPAAY